MNDGYPQTEDRVRTWLTERPCNDYGDVPVGVEVTTGGQLIGLVRLHGAEAETGCAELDIYLVSAYRSECRGRYSCKYTPRRSRPTHDDHPRLGGDPSW